MNEPRTTPVRAARAALPAVLSILCGVGCTRPSTPAPERPREAPVDRAVADAQTVPSVIPDALPSEPSMDAGGLDAALSAGPPAVLTLRIVNAASRAVPIFTNPDLNEMIHTRRLRSRRASADGGRDSDPVKFFPVGQMPLCAQDGGAGYGGLGQPERRELAPGEAIEFAWDGLERREILDPARGVCLEVGPPNPGRYRFELDQPRRTLRCDDVEFSWPLRAGAPTVLEMRCRFRTREDDRGSAEDEG
jgi:hypothetical protein